MKPGLSRLLRLGTSVALLGALALVVDPAPVLRRLREMDGGWVAVALGLTALQVGLSAWRWRFTAHRLGLRLPLNEAVREYYLATFLNQVLPGGVVGDVARAWRHGRKPDIGAAGRAVRAVILERASGQAVMVAVAAVSLAVLAPAAAGAAGPAGTAVAPGLREAAAAMVAGIVEWAPAVLGVVCLGAGGVAGLIWARRHRHPDDPGLGGRILRDAWDGLLSPSALPVQLLTSAAVVGSYLALGVAAARAVGVTTPTTLLLPLMAPVLLAMLIPLTVAGWGLREGAAALVWTVAGLPAADGVAAFMAYGIFVLLGALPGALLLVGSRAAVRVTPAPPNGDPGRRGRPGPGGSGGTEDGGPGPASRWDPASGPGGPTP